MFPTPLSINVTLVAGLGLWLLAYLAFRNPRRFAPFSPVFIAFSGSILIGCTLPMTGPELTTERYSRLDTLTIHSPEHPLHYVNIQSQWERKALICPLFPTAVIPLSDFRLVEEPRLQYVTTQASDLTPTNAMGTRDLYIRDVVAPPYTPDLVHLKAQFATMTDFISSRLKHPIPPSVAQAALNHAISLTDLNPATGQAKLSSSAVAPNAWRFQQTLTYQIPFTSTLRWVTLALLLIIPASFFFIRRKAATDTDLGIQPAGSVPSPHN